MRYQVQLWRTTTSKKPELERIVRASSVDDAIGSVMKSFDWNYAGRGLALPTDKDLKEALPEHWRRGIRCRQSGEVSYTNEREKVDELQSFPANSLWTLL